MNTRVTSIFFDKRGIFFPILRFTSPLLIGKITRDPIFNPDANLAIVQINFHILPICTSLLKILVEHYSNYFTLFTLFCDMILN